MRATNPAAEMGSLSIGVDSACAALHHRPAPELVKGMCPWRIDPLLPPLLL